MAQFNNANDFVGSYSGSYDGRQAEVAIEGGEQGLLDVCELCSLWLQSSQTSNNRLPPEAATKTCTRG